MRCLIMLRSQRTQRSASRNVSPSSSHSSPQKVSSMSLSCRVMFPGLVPLFFLCSVCVLGVCLLWSGGGVVGPEYILTLCSIRKMPPGETKNSQWRRHYIRNDFPRLRKLRRSPQNLSRKVPSGIPPPPSPPTFPSLDCAVHVDMRITLT